MSRDLKGKAEMPPSSGRVTGKDTREAVTRRRHLTPFFAGNKGIPPPLLVCRSDAEEVLQDTEAGQTGRSQQQQQQQQEERRRSERVRQQQLSLPAFAPAHALRLHASV